ncbi:unnamed protein product [Knipowitschia caucasica]
MKTMERLILTHLRSVVSPTLDPLQFAYRPNIGVEDAVIYFLQRTLSHLEPAGSAVRVMFFDFSSAFNTIRPALLRGKMEDAGVDSSLTAWTINYLTAWTINYLTAWTINYLTAWTINYLTAWTINYLTAWTINYLTAWTINYLTAWTINYLTAWTINYLSDRPQHVRLRSCESEVVVCSTGAPQGTVLSPFLFTIYTSDFTHDTHSCHLQKFSDDSAIVGCVSEGNELEYRSVIKDFVDWCERNHLCLNTSKTKEMVIDFRRKPLSHTLLNIQGEDIELVDSFKYLCSH